VAWIAVPRLVQQAFGARLERRHLVGIKNEGAARPGRIHRRRLRVYARKVGLPVRHTRNLLRM